MGLIKWLETWYKKNGNGALPRIKIQGIDNPGWGIDIDLRGTELEGQIFELNVDNSDDDWIICSVRDNLFTGVGDVDKLSKVIKTFKAWNEKKAADVKPPMEDDEMLYWIQDWTKSNCDGDWEHCGGFEIKTIKSGWKVTIDISGLTPEPLPTRKMTKAGGKDNWINCSLIDEIFIGEGTADQLGAILQVFKDWAEATYGMNEEPV